MNKDKTGNSKPTVEWRWFVFGSVIFLVGALFAAWGFSGESLAEHQRRILLWILPLSAGFAAGAFAGSLTVQARKLVPGVAITATSGFAVWFMCFWFLFPSPNGKPIVVLMESTLPLAVYDPGTRAVGGTNADDITDILKDLPIRLVAEATNLQWRREQQILSLEPKLIIIHLSCFYSETNIYDSDERFRSFLRFMAASRAHFIVYTRGLPAQPSPDTLNRWEAQMAFLRNGIDPDRITLFAVKGGQKATFRDPTTARELKLHVKQILRLA